MPSGFRLIDQFQGLADVNWPSFADGQVAKYDQASGKIIGLTSVAKSLYLPLGWDTAWKAAKAASGTTPAWMLAIGDSITAGQQATSYLTQGFFGLLRAALVAKYGAYADFYQHNFDDADNLVNTPPLPWTHVGGSAVNSTGFAGTLQFTAAGSATFVTPAACTGLDILYHDRIVGSFTYTLDGGAPVTVTGAANGAVRRVTLGRAFANTTHTIVVTWVSGVFNLVGVAVYYATTGLGFANLGVGGLQSTAFSGTATNSPTALLGSNNTNQGFAFGFPTQPSLAVLAMGVNDATNGNIGPDGWYLCYRRMIESIRRRSPNCSILLISPTMGDSLYGDGGAMAGGADDWGLYTAQAAALAANMGCAWLSLDARWGSTPVAQGFITVGNVHPTIAGHADIAAALQGVLV